MRERRKSGWQCLGGLAAGSAAVLILLAAMLVPDSAFAKKPWTLTPRYDSFVEYDSNILSTTVDEEDDLKFNVQPGFDLEYQETKHLFNFKYNVRSEFFRAKEDFNNEYHEFNVRYTYRVTPNFIMQLANEFQDFPESLVFSETEDFGDVIQRRTGRTTNRASGSFQWTPNRRWTLNFLYTNFLRHFAEMRELDNDADGLKDEDRADDDWDGLTNEDADPLLENCDFDGDGIFEFPCDNDADGVTGEDSAGPGDDDDGDGRIDEDSEESGQNDTELNSFVFSTAYTLDPKTSLQGNVRWEVIKFNGTDIARFSDSRQAYFQLGFVRLIGKDIVFDLAVGPVLIRQLHSSDIVVVSPDTAPALFVSRAPVFRKEIEPDVPTHKVDWSMNTSLTKQWRKSSFTLSYFRTVTGGGSFGTTSVQQNYGASFESDLRRKWRINLRVRYRLTNSIFNDFIATGGIDPVTRLATLLDADAFGIGDELDLTGITASAKLTYRVAKDWRTFLEYRFIDRDSDGTSSSDFTQHKVRLGLRWEHPFFF